MWTKCSSIHSHSVYVTTEHYFEDFEVGQIFHSGALKVTETAIIKFAREFDPQVFHLNSEQAARTMMKGLIASGWHTAAMSMRLFVETMNAPGGIIGLGVDELRWPHPVRPGDELRLEIEIVSARPSKSHSGAGIIRVHNVTRNQHGEIVQSFSANAMVPARLSGK
jgi:acyl dehydratase